MYQRKRDRIYRDPVTGRMMEHKGYAVRIHWSTDMLDYLRDKFPVTPNEELAGALGVSVSTLLRKARQLALRKDRRWLREVWSQNRLLAQHATRMGRNPGVFRKGGHANPGGEYRPGRVLTPEQQAKRRQSILRYYALNPGAGRRRALKSWETRRKRQGEASASSEDTHKF